MRSKADIELELAKEAANDPKRTFALVAYPQPDPTKWPSFLPPGDSMEQHQGGRLVPEPLSMVRIGSESTSPPRARNE